MGMVRRPAVAGHFYTGDPAELRRELDRLVPERSPREAVLGIVSPHAGYIYSGAVAGEVYASIEVPRDVIILGPNHHGLGERAALHPAGEWLTPLGAVSVNGGLGDLILAQAPLVRTDSRAHTLEHSLEVQVPFLQYMRPDVTIVPLCLGFGDFASCQALGHAIARAVREWGRPVLIVASSDMTHYESAAAAKEKDDLALGELLALRPEGLLETCRRHGITMCGVIPAVVMLAAALELGASRARLVCYATSGDVTGDNRNVVAYAGVTVA